MSGPSAIEPAAPSAAPAAVPAPEPVPQAAQTPQAAGYASSSKVFNPDISAIGNFVSAAGSNPSSDQPSMQLSEAEVAFQAVVDPYAKADFFLSAGPEGLEIEEGFITFTTLPAGLLLKAGKMRAQFGKVNTMHTHILPWADRPLVMQNLLGGDEGLSDSGFSVSKLIPNDFIFLEGIGEVFQGNDSLVFQSDKRSRLTYLGRLRAYRDSDREHQHRPRRVVHARTDRPRSHAGQAADRDRRDTAMAAAPAGHLPSVRRPDGAGLEQAGPAVQCDSRDGRRAGLGVRFLQQRGLSVRPPVVHRRPRRPVRACAQPRAP